MKTAKGGAAAVAQKNAAPFTPPRQSLGKRLQSLGKRLKKSWQLYLFVAPALIGLIIFSYIPMYGVILAFKDYSPFQGIWGSDWVGLEHFQRFFNSPYFVQLLMNTLAISLYGLLVGFPIPIILALGLNSVKRQCRRLLMRRTSFPRWFLLVSSTSCLRTRALSISLLTSLDTTLFCSWALKNTGVTFMCGQVFGKAWAGAPSFTLRHLPASAPNCTRRPSLTAPQSCSVFSTSTCRRLCPPSLSR